MYSPIDKIYIKDFRNLGEVELSFQDSPIICLVGDNEAGKTSVVKAFSVCALHSTPRDQKSFIRTGTQMFGVAIFLKDGSKVIRMKTPDVNKYQVVRPDGSLWETSKIAEGLPVEVQNIMGLIEEPETKEFLHIRTYEDKLLFVVTPSSTNYKVMYNSLKVEQLTKAIKKGSTEANTLKSNLSKTENSVNTLQNQINQIRLVDMEPLIDVRARLTENLSLLDKLEKAKEYKRKINECAEKLGIVRLISTFKLEEIDISLAMRLNSIGRVVNNLELTESNLSRLSEINSVDVLDIGLVDRIKSVMNLKTDILTRKKELGSLTELKNAEEVSEYTAGTLLRLRNIKSKIDYYKSQIHIDGLNKCEYIDESIIHRLSRVITLKEVNNIDKENKDKIDVYVSQVINWMKQQGVAFETCQNCGSDVLIDLDKIGDTTIQ